MIFSFFWNFLLLLLVNERHLCLIRSFRSNATYYRNKKFGEDMFAMYFASSTLFKLLRKLFVSNYIQWNLFKTCSMQNLNTTKTSSIWNNFILPVEKIDYIMLIFCGMGNGIPLTRKRKTIKKPEVKYFLKIFFHKISIHK